MQMLAAVAAIFFRSIVGAQPMSPSLAFRIDALDGPSWQIAHAASRAFKSTAPKLGDRILRPENCGVKAKGPTYRGLFADLWKSIQSANAEWPGGASAVLDRKLPDVYSIGHH